MTSPGALRQYLAALCAALSNFSSSVAYVWIAPLLVRLKGPESELPLSPGQSSWVVSFIQLGNFMGTTSSAFLVDRLGRKLMLLFTAPIFIVSWILILATRSVEILYCVRILQGVGLGTINTVLPLYLAEISEPQIRATLGYFFQGIWYVGNLYVYSIGPFVSYQNLTWISMIPPLIFLLAFGWFPETPYYLMMKKRRKEAEQSLAWFRGSTTDEIQTELNSIDESIQEEIKNKASWHDIVGTPVGRRGFVIVILVAASYIMCGGTALFSYATETFSKSGAGGVRADMYTIVMGVCVLLAVPFSGVAVDKMGRRPVLLVSSIGSTICLIATSLYYYMSTNTDVDLSEISWTPFFTIILYTVLIGAGVEAIVPVLQAELFANSTRGVASGLSYSFMTLMSFFCLKMYQVIADGVGFYFLYACFAFFAALGSVYIYFCVPETKGKTFAEIQIILGTKTTN